VCYIMTKKTKEHLAVKKYCAKRALLEEYTLCSLENWNGDAAAAVTKITYTKAYDFLDALPASVEAPEVCASPDGDINLEWYRTPQLMLVVSVSDDVSLYYNGVDGTDDVHGTAAFTGDIPKLILGWIKMITKHA